MGFILELILNGIPAVILTACLVYFVKFALSEEKGKRVKVRWKEISLAKKTAAGLVAAWSFLNLYLIIGNILFDLSIVAIPLSSTYEVRPATIWGVTFVMLGLVFLYSTRFPKPRITV